MKKIELTQGKFAIVDDGDFEKLNKYKWHVHKSGYRFYAERNERRGFGRITAKMHREITNAPNDMYVDHIDGDGLNNTRSNLRVCTNAQNQYNSRKPSNNTSGFKGVSWHKRNKKWLARIKVNNKQNNLGYFDSLIEAAQAYDEAAKRYYGTFANLNF
jgi:hypothetical protein